MYTRVTISDNCGHGSNSILLNAVPCVDETMMTECGKSMLCRITRELIRTSSVLYNGGSLGGKD